MLVTAIKRAEVGRIDADLGGGVIKQRLAKPARGKSGGYRMLVLFRYGKRAVFVIGFAQNDREIAEGLHQSGAVDRRTMREFDTVCLKEAKSIEPSESRFHSQYLRGI
jgi:hypothetical protein